MGDISSVALQQMGRSQRFAGGLSSGRSLTSTLPHYNRLFQKGAYIFYTLEAKIAQAQYLELIPPLWVFINQPQEKEAGNKKILYVGTYRM